MATKKAKLGIGSKFKALTKKFAAKGAKKLVAKKKYGVKKMSKMSVKGKKKGKK